jgi:hypothetical protein
MRSSVIKPRNGRREEECAMPVAVQAGRQSLRALITFRDKAMGCRRGFKGAGVGWGGGGGRVDGTRKGGTGSKGERGGWGGERERL